MKTLQNSFYFLGLLALIGLSACNQLDTDEFPDDGNLPVRAEGDEVYVIPGEAVLIDLLQNDVILADATFEITQQPSLGVAQITESGQCIYLANNATTSGTDEIRYRLTSGNDFSDGVISITLTNDTTNIPCYFLNLQSDYVQLASADELNNSIVIDVLANDLFCDGTWDINSLAVVFQPLQGSASLGNNAVIYDATADFFPANEAYFDFFIYSVNRSDNNTTGYAVAIIEYIPTATCATVIPEANSDELMNVAIGQEICVNVLANDVYCELDIDWSSITVNDPPAYGTASVVMSDSGYICYTADSSFAGQDVFAYEFCTLSGDCYVSQVYVSGQTSSCNVQTLALADEMVDVAVGQPLCLDLLANDVYCADEIDWSSLNIKELPGYGNAVFNTYDSGYVCYTADSSFAGQDYLRYEFCTLNGDCYDAILSISGIASNCQLIEAVTDALDSTQVGTTSCVNVLANDVFCMSELDTSSFQIVQQPNAGTATLGNTLGEVCYDASSNYQGQDHFIYQVCLFNGTCVQGVVEVY